MQRQKHQLLLLEDVDGLGRSGDVVTAKPGFIRNFLLPKKMAVIASKHTLQMQEKLKEERSKRAVLDKKESEELAKKIDTMTFEIEVKVDPDGHMYGSVTSHDLVHLFEKEGFIVDRKNFLLAHPIKSIGEHTVPMRLKEGVTATCKLQVNSDIEIVKPVVQQPAPEEITVETTEELPESAE